MTKYIVCLFLCLSLSGCATFFYKKDLSDQVTSWSEKHQYDRALQTIAAISPDHIEYQELQTKVPSLERQRLKYIRRILSEAKKFEDTQDWVAAESRIDEGLEALPESPEFKNQKDYYQSKRTRRIQMDNVAILIAKARYYIDARPHQESYLYNSETTSSDIQQYNLFMAEADEVSRQLYAVGLHYWQDQKVSQAKQALLLSTRTSRNELSQALLEDVLSFEQKARAKALNKQKKLASNQAEELQQNFTERLNFNDFEGALRILNEMEALNLASHSQMHSRLVKKRDDRIEALIANGNTLYNSGLIEEAVSRWEEAYTLDPENTSVKEKIERAKRFLTNFKRWKQ